MYARNPSIILQNMNFSRYYRYRAQLIYSFDLNIVLWYYSKFFLIDISCNVNAFGKLYHQIKVHGKFGYLVILF